MKTLLLAAVAILAWTSTARATVISLKPTQPWTKLAHEREMEAYVVKIFEAAGKKMNVPVVIDPAARDNCAYASSHEGQDYIGVYMGCVGPLRHGKGYNAFAIGVLCHEAGHILAQHTREYHATQAEESEADERSGWLMYRLGLTLEQAVTSASQMPEQDTPSHPRRTVRIVSVVRGWRNAQAGGSPVSRGSSWWADLMATRLPWVKDPGQ